MKFTVCCQLSALIISLLLTISCSTPQTDVPIKPQNVSPLLVGSEVPGITLSDPYGEMKLLSEIAAQHTLIVFYRGGWCPFCSAELSAIAEIEDELYEKGITIVGISPDRPEYLKESLNNLDTEFTLLSDSDMIASKAFGIAFREDEETVTQLRENGMDLEERSGRDHHLLPVPSVFLINNEGRIEFQYVNPNYKERINHNILMAAADAMLVGY